MRAKRAIGVWLAASAACMVVVVRATYITDLSAFLPANPTHLQRLLVDQLRDGPASRLVLIALEHGSAAERAGVSVSMAQRLRRDPQFSNVEDGTALTAGRDRDFLFEHRYVLSGAITAQRFSVAGLHQAIGDTVLDLTSAAGMLMKSLVPHDPTGEMLEITERLAQAPGPRTADGVWVSADGARTLLVAQTAAPGSDTDAQERALFAIKGAFDAASAAHRGLRMRASGPGVFAVAARARIKQAAVRLSIVSSVLVIGVLLAVYRSMLAVLLGMLPVATGAVAGIAAVALGFGAVHGITLGFGITLIGEAVDYSVYFFVQALRHDAPASTEASWRRTLWPTVRLGVLTSVCGFASLVPSGFPGLAQLGLYSICGLIAAACVTRFVLPALLPRDMRIRDLSGLGSRIEGWRDALRNGAGGAVAGVGWVIAVAALLVLYRHQDTLWNRELSALSPVDSQDLAYDARLRADLGTANVLELIVVEGDDLQTALHGAELAEAALRPMHDAHLIGELDSPAHYLPSAATQAARRAALPEGPELRRRLVKALDGIDLAAGRLTPFVADVEAARAAQPLARADLQGTSLATGFDALMLQKSGHWSALLPLRAPDGAAVDARQVEAALAAAGLKSAHVLDLKLETDALYLGYLAQASRLSLYGLLLIVLLLVVTLRSLRRAARVLAPLLLAVLSVAAAHAALGSALTILHLVAMLLIVAVGSNYALFFDQEAAREPGAAAPLTLASLAIANLCTVIGFGLLSFSKVPVLVALGTTVAPGALLALLYCAVLTPPASGSARA